jgi:colicin import membrane protein
MNEENALALIDNRTGSSLIEAFQPNGLESLIKVYRDRAMTFKGDISTKKGRDEIRSFAANISKDKSSLEKLGKKSMEDLQKTVKAVTAERIRAVSALQEIQDTVRKPLTDWENADDERQRVEREKQAAIDLAEKSEKLRIASEEKAKKDAEAVKLKAENDAKLAAEKAEKEKQAAIQAERDRAESERKREADEAAKREANKAHRTKINNEILHDLNKVIGGIEADEAVIGKAIITAIAQGEIRHVHISY